MPKHYRQGNLMMTLTKKSRLDQQSDPILKAINQSMPIISMADNNIPQ